MSCQRWLGGRGLLAAGLAVTIMGLLGAVLAPVAVGAHLTTFGAPRATATFAESIVFEQPVTILDDARRAGILIEFPGAIGPTYTEVATPARGSRTLRHQLDLATDHVLPNTRITARWRIVGTDGQVSVSPPVGVTYRDTRFDWQSRSGALVTVHWYRGDAEFGRRALEIGEAAVKKVEDLLGVRESEPIDFFVYAAEGPFRDALGPGTRENVGGQANAGIRTLFALITPSEINASWVGIVIPHELTHLVFDTAVENPYHFPPRWLNEGLAVYLSQGYEPSDRSIVEAAVRDGSLIPLDGLTGQFPTTIDQFSQAYAESVSAVEFLVRTYDQAALVKLIRSYADGRTDDEAFTAALGIDTAAFNEAWFEDLGAAPATRYGPQPAPPGPLPPGWTGAPGTSPVPASSGAPATPGGTPDQNVPDGTGGRGNDVGGARTIGLVLGALAAILAVAGGIQIQSARRRRAAIGPLGRTGTADGPPAPWTPSGSDRPEPSWGPPPDWSAPRTSLPPQPWEPAQPPAPTEPWRPGPPLPQTALPPEPMVEPPRSLWLDAVPPADPRPPGDRPPSDPPPNAE